MIENDVDFDGAPIILYQARNTDPAVAVYLKSLKVFQSLQNFSFQMVIVNISQNMSLPDSWDGRDHGFVSSVE